MKKQNEIYKLTPKGFFSLTLPEPRLTEFLDSLELFLRRNDYNAIVFDEKEGFLFIKVEKSK